MREQSGRPTLYVTLEIARLVAPEDRSPASTWTPEIPGLQPRQRPDDTRALTRRVTSVTESGRDRRPAMVGDEIHVDSGAVPDQVGGVVVEGGVAGDRVEVGVTPVSEPVGARNDNAAGVDLAAAVTGHAVVRHQGAGRAKQQDAAALEGHRRFPVFRAELVVAEHAVVKDGDVTSGTAPWPTWPPTTCIMPG